MNKSLKQQLIEATKIAQKLGYENARLVQTNGEFTLELGSKFYEKPQWEKFEAEVLQRIPGYMEEGTWYLCAQLLGPRSIVVA